MIKLIPSMALFPLTLFSFPHLPSTQPLRHSICIFGLVLPLAEFCPCHKRQNVFHYKSWEASEMVQWINKHLTPSLLTCVWLGVGHWLYYKNLKMDETEVICCVLVDALWKLHGNWSDTGFWGEYSRSMTSVLVFQPMAFIADLIVLFYYMNLPFLFFPVT